MVDKQYRCCLVDKEQKQNRIQNLKGGIPFHNRSPFNREIEDAEPGPNQQTKSNLTISGSIRKQFHEGFGF